jgi:hypothetical protein
MLVGGLIGYMVSRINPPLYQASALIQVSIDESRASIPNDITIRQAYDRVRIIILADDTLISALDRFSDSAGDIETIPTLEEFRSEIKLAQRFNAFELVVNAVDPGQAASLANYWGEIALQEIEAATQYALMAGEYQSALFEASCTIRMDEVESEVEAIWHCASGRDDIDPDALSAGLLEAVKRSRGVLPVFSFSWARRAETPIRSSDIADGWLVLAGSLLGLIGMSILELYRIDNLES